MPYFDGSHARLYYLDEGEGPAVVLVNGLIMAAQHWGAQRDKLIESHRVLRYDQRCQGRSSVDRGFHYSALVADLRELLDHLDIDRASICGISYGSFVAKQFAVEHPERCRHLALIAPLRAIDGHLDCVYSVWRALLRTGELRAFAQSVTMLSYNRPWPALVADHHEQGLQLFEQHWTGEQVLALLHSFDDAKDLSNYDQVAVPTLVIGATGDRIHAPDDAVRIAREVPGARLHMLDGSHALTIDRPAEVNELLTSFFASSA